MSLSALLLSSAFGMCLLAFMALGIGVWGAVSYRSMRGRIKDVTTCGYVAPPPTPEAVRSLNRVARFFIGIQVGKVKYVGLENLHNLTEPNIVSANHPHWIDPLIISQALNRPARYMAHGRVMQSLGGLLGVYLSKRGVFAAQDNIKDGGVRTREAATQMLVSGQQMVIFPEGLTNFSPSIDDLRPGAVKIAREAAIRLGKPVYIVPAYTRYGKYPGKWLARFDRAVQFFMVFFGFAFYRRGAVCNIGKPISTTELYGPTLTERSDNEAMALLKARLESLDPAR
ncbi:MAG: 1-acyl-sn-glycerol-3-phosphate acyltransferase [Cyanobacteria bacterium SZAS LIN-2]|nr:1-acyl-sn-glycerol-3-phosphate acyltransferase [Cyanobacteria bacterium SZAS LIN-3]MBS1995406.1 1-acyl-sn-glycerol-3-phosphate acyltransferase [Cyanobacteria bacterium SZAS LIN-2]MBS2010682.1 1-acyl-sn-glycerol-3-phosphate acyltransferase [Cyanobacteria bacterium SZAS TMP-1]